MSAGARASALQNINGTSVIDADGQKQSAIHRVMPATTDFRKRGNRFRKSRNYVQYAIFLKAF